MEELEDCIYAQDAEALEKKIFDCCKAIIHDESSEHMEALICHYGQEDEFPKEKDLLSRALTGALKRILQTETQKEQIFLLERFIRIFRASPMQLGEGMRFLLMQKVILDEFCHNTKTGVLCAEILVTQNIPSAFWKIIDIKKHPDFWYFFLQSMIVERESIARIAAAVASSPLEEMSKEFQVRAFHAIEDYRPEGIEEILLSAPPWFKRFAEKQEAA